MPCLQSPFYKLLSLILFELSPHQSLNHQRLCQVKSALQIDAHQVD